MKSGFDVAIVGGGAAGLATAIFAARRNPSLKICILDGAKKLGAKILVSGGGRCNVTNTVVRPGDFWGGSSHIIKRVLGALPVAETVEFFRGLGVTLHEEPNGKLFPDTNSARTVLDALVREAERLGVVILTGHRIASIAKRGEDFCIAWSGGEIRAPRAVLATGGLSLPKTGSDGAGYEFARGLGHSIVPTTPALAPLLLAGGFHAPLSGLSHDVEIAVRVEKDKPVRIGGSLLWTHFGISGPVVLNASRVWHRAHERKFAVQVAVNLLPGRSFEEAEAALLKAAESQPKAMLQTVIGTMVPAKLGAAVLDSLRINPRIPMAHLSREVRRRLLVALRDWPLEVVDSRGYGYAEATAGGVALDEIDPATMQSRRCPGLYLVGEILDVDGRIGGFNFQWAWSSAFVAAHVLSGGNSGA